MRTEGTLVFEPGQRSATLDVVLTPESASFNVFPKRFQIVLFDPKGGARIDPVYGTANVTLVSDVDSQAIWQLADQLHQPLHEDVVNSVLHKLNLRVATESTDEQLSAVMHLLEKVGHPCRCETWPRKRAIKPAGQQIPYPLIMPIAMKSE